MAIDMDRSWPINPIHCTSGPMGSNIYWTREMAVVRNIRISDSCNYNYSINHRIMALTKRDYPEMNPNLNCGECGSPMALRDSKYGIFYGCTNYPQCKGTHSAHQDTGAPMGIPADKETKEWRSRCHKVFDQLWKNKKYAYTRSEAYELLQRLTRLSPEDCHIGRFNIDQCKTVINRIEKYYLK